MSEIKCLVVGVLKIARRKSKFVIVEILNPEINFVLTKNSKLAGYAVEPQLHLLRILNKNGTPRFNTYGIRPLGKPLDPADWDVFKDNEIVLLTGFDVVE